MKVHDLLTTHDKWTQNAAARLPDGTATAWNDPAAVQWDLLGAIYHCYPVAEAREIELRCIVRLFGSGKRKLGQCLSVWGDSSGRTFKEIRQVIVAEDI